MKLPGVLGGLLTKKTETREILCSILLDVDYVAAALWQMGDKNVPEILATNTQAVAENNWEARLDATDEALANIEDIAGTTRYEKVVLGLPSSYLTQTGEIIAEIRPHIKTITKELELKPIGFVSLHQALMYKLKKDEGVPPSVILLGVSHKFLSLSMYKVGSLVGQKELPRSADAAIDLEEILKEFKHLEVLPARILLYGVDGKNLEDLKNELLRYPWTTRVNFLHFPKIELVTPEQVVSAISLAGASELATEVHEEEDVAAATPAIKQPEPVAEPASTETADSVSAEANAQDIEEGEAINEEEAAGPEESNVVVVDPSKLGFRKNVDVLEHVEAASASTAKKRLTIPPIPHVNISEIFKKISSGGIVPIAIIAGIVVVFLIVVFWFLPHATVTILESPKDITDAQQITIDPTATVVDAQNKIVPGAKLEKSVSGEKTIPVTGTKKVGDPAKGTVTIYNKTLSTQTLKKGTTLTSDSLKFTLDSDVTLQAATVTGSLGSVTKTFGQSTGVITASAIGMESNLPANKTFTMENFSSDEMSANNGSALTGGTAKDVTVVTRADYDAFIKAVTGDLVDQAKKELSASVGGGQKLIDETITTAVTQKTFSQELDQEAKELSGKVTLTVSGISYTEDDIKTLLTAFISNQIPSGYTLAEGRTSISIAGVVVKKDGKITAKATIKGTAVPTLDLATIQKSLAGKSINDAQKYLRAMSGVAGVEVSFRTSLFKNRLPANAKNISVGLAIQ